MSANIYIVADPFNTFDKLIVVADTSVDATDLYKDLRKRDHAYIVTNHLNFYPLLERVQKLRTDGYNQGYFDFDFEKNQPTHNQLYKSVDATFVPHNFRKEKLKRFFKL